MQGLLSSNKLAYAKNSIFAFIVYLFVHTEKSFKNLGNTAVKHQTCRVITGKTTASEIEKFLVGYAVDGERMARLDIVRMYHESRNSTNLSRGPEEDMSFFEFPYNVGGSLFDIYRAVKEYFPTRIRERENMNLTRCMTRLKWTFNDSLYFSIARCMESTSYLGGTSDSRMYDMKVKVPARTRTIEIKSCPLRKDDDLIGIIIRFVENSPRFVRRNADNFRKNVQGLNIFLTFHII